MDWFGLALVGVALAFMTHGFNFVTINKHEHKHYHGSEGDSKDAEV
ncbi:hypothetical protein J27TS7_57910 [Paenibacillus dendritiformis]|nr:hypothetical protein J27TS7_57910 [Paenibacillus dendritiformis]